MNDEKKCHISRRKAIGLFATGVWTVVESARSYANPAKAGQDSAHETLSLDGVWNVVAMPLKVEGAAGYKAFKQGIHKKLTARVPGEIHLDLMHAGLMEDPNISDNARTRCRWPENQSWWYSREFVIPAGFTSNLRQRLIFDGIDLYGQIFLNGTLIGTAKDAFSTVLFDVRGALQEGTNELVVRVTSGMELPRQFTIPTAEAAAYLKGLESVYAVRRLELVQGSQRKPRCAYGTDFCDPLPNIGLWRSVRLEGRSKLIIHHLRLDTVIREKGVYLEGEITVENLHPWSEIAANLELRIDPPSGSPITQTLAFAAKVGRSTLPCRVTIPNPQLWWPNGMGDQPLYQLTARVLCGDLETDRQRQTIGLRTVELDRSALPQGARFGVKVNGRKVFCKGGNWVPTDLILARTTAEHYERLVSEACDAHFNMLRVNGDSLYESDVFYDACDRAGILVWQEFTFSDALYRDWDPEFIALVRNEAEGVVRRLRYHPSLALWCGNNECQFAMGEALKSNATKREDIGGTQIYNEILPDICHFYDPVRPYWPGSPSGGVDPNSEIAGDFHGLGDEGLKNATFQGWREAADKSRARFVSEAYAIGPPNFASVREYLKADELSLASHGWRIHTNEQDGGVAAAGIGYHYGDPSALSLPQFILYGQMYQALIVGGLLEALRFRKSDPVNECQGLLMWSYNDTWGEMGWSMVDHYLRRKASYYWFKRAATSVKVLVRSGGETLITRVVNDTLEPHSVSVRYGWMRVDGTESRMQQHIVMVPANGTVEVARTVVPAASALNPREWLYAATLEGNGVPSNQAIWPLAPHRELALAAPSISTRVENGVLWVSSTVYCHGVHFDDQGQDVLADNYFDLLPGVAQRIAINHPTPSNPFPLTAIVPIATQSVRAPRTDTQRRGIERSPS